jgi:hypothetical protein
MVQYDWSTLTDDEFEELCKELMRRKGFRNVRRMSGPGAGDRGRDIHAEEHLPSATGGEIHTRILVQCKNYWGSRTTICPSDVEGLAQRARSLGYNRILIITSHDLSSQAKTTALDMATNPSWGIIAEWWNNHDLIGFILKYPDLRTQFSIAMITPSVFNIAILDGYASNRTTEKPCTPFFSNVSPKNWGNLLQNKNTSISFISTAEIDISFDAIVNPFGENYPEENNESKTTYNRILTYIRSGGVFVNVAGFPFFYYWDHEQGINVPVARVKQLYIPDRGLLSFIHFDDTLLYNDFGISVDSRSPTGVTIYQEDEDRVFVGNLLELGIEKVTQFRAVISGSPNTIPLVRAEEGRIYPLAAIQYGNGHLLLSGLQLSLQEAPLVSTALKNWLLTSGGKLSLTRA